MAHLHLEPIRVDSYEEVVYAEEPSVGLKAIIAIHNTNLGPACGGIRLLPYGSREEALQDVLRLSRGMSYKSALAGIKFGGGKSVIILDPSKKTTALFHTFGEFVDSFKGRYISAKDMNIDGPDLVKVKEKTKHVLGIDGVPGSSGDPSPVTARGLYKAVEATAEEILGSRSLSGLNIIVQGVGHVGYSLVEMLVKAKANVTISDIDVNQIKKTQEQFGVSSVGIENVFDSACDIFSPCARGAVLNSKTIEKLKCKAVVGAANNQLATPQDGYRLHEKGIWYAPDYAANAGGIINVYMEHVGYDQEKAMQMADGIFDTMKTILQRSKSEKLPPFVVADHLAEERMLHAKR